MTRCGMRDGLLMLGGRINEDGAVNEAIELWLCAAGAGYLWSSLAAAVGMPTLRMQAGTIIVVALVVAWAG